MAAFSPPPFSLPLSYSQAVNVRAPWFAMTKLVLISVYALGCWLHQGLASLYSYSLLSLSFAFCLAVCLSAHLAADLTTYIFIPILVVYPSISFSAGVCSLSSLSAGLFSDRALFVRWSTSLFSDRPSSFYTSHSLAISTASAYLCIMPGNSSGVGRRCSGVSVMTVMLPHSPVTSQLEALLHNAGSLSCNSSVARRHGQHEEIQRIPSGCVLFLCSPARHRRMNRKAAAVSSSVLSLFFSLARFPLSSLSLLSVAPTLIFPSPSLSARSIPLSLCSLSIPSRACLFLSVSRRVRSICLLSPSLSLSPLSLALYLLFARYYSTFPVSAFARSPFLHSLPTSLHQQGVHLSKWK